MTISTGDGLVAGIIGVPTIIGKDSASNEAAGISHTPWYASGIIGAGGAPTGGLNGVTFSGTVAGQIPVPAAAAGSQSYVERLSLVHTGGIGHIWVIDRLWGNVPVVTTTTGQAVISPTWPARDTSASTNGAGVYLAIETSATTGNAGAITNTTVTYCVDPSTECLTKRGWLRHDELTLDDELLAFDPVTRRTRWERPREIYVNERYAGDMVLLSNGRGWSALVTPDHRWPIVSRARRPGDVQVRQTSELPRHDWSLLAAAEHDAPTEQTFSDAFVRVVAWYTTEGSLVHGGKNITMCQSSSANPVHVEDIRRDLKEIGGLCWSERTCIIDGCVEPPAAREMCRRHYHHWWTHETKNRRRLLGKTPGRRRRRGLWVHEYLRRSDIVTWLLSGDGTDAITACAPGKGKVPTMAFLAALTRDQLRMFVATCVAGDGTPEKQQLFQHHEPRMSAFMAAAALAGHGPTLDRSGTTCSLGAVGRRIYLGRVERRTLYYEGPVWCPVTDAGHWVARRNGKVFITGNTNSAGVAGRTATLASFPITGLTGTWLPFSLQAGDVGVRSVQTVTLGTSYVSGAVHIMAYRLVASIPVPNANIGNDRSWASLGLPKVWDNSVLQLVYFPTGSAVGALVGEITYAQG